MTDRDCKALCNADAMVLCKKLLEHPVCLLVAFEICMDKCKSNDGGYCQQSFETDALADNSLVI